MAIAKHTVRKRILSVLFWSIISAAFIGPGTVTTASKAGAAFGLDLVWALVFSIIATIFLQEAAARISIASGKNLGEIVADSARGSMLYWVLFLAVAFGCAAYQAGNILGAVSGALLFASWPKWAIVLLIGGLCFAVLWIGNFRWIANMLGFVVAAMGALFVYVALQIDVSVLDVAKSAVTPAFPSASAILIIGLIGTTIVPYNLFLASGISRGQSIRDMRFGMTGAILIGGLISLAILVVGTQVDGAFDFQALATTLASETGHSMHVFFGLGLLAAGLSSSITAPFAAAVTAKTLFERQGSHDWSSNSRRFRAVWMIVLVIGLFFGLSDIKPIPAIILAQAINGVLLPVVAIWLLLLTNRPSVVGAHRNSLFRNGILIVIVYICTFLGVYNILSAAQKVGIPLMGSTQQWIAMVTAGIVLGWVGIRHLRRRP